MRADEAAAGVEYFNSQGRKTMKLYSLRSLAVIAVSASILAACSNGGSSDNTGELRLGLTDGPVEKANSVVVAFTGVQLKAADSGEPMDPVTFDANSCDTWDAATGTCSIDLLDLVGQERRVVFSKSLPPGNYEWIRLLVDADRNELDSYIQIDAEGMMCPLWIPSGAQSGLKAIKDITVTTNGVSDYTLDFDVRKSVTAPPGLNPGADSMEMCAQNYILKPVIRIVDNTKVGAIGGTVSTETLAINECAMDDMSGEYINVAAYIFENFDGNAVADDIDGVVEDTDGEAGGLVARDPVTTATVSYDVDSESYRYEAGFLLAPEDYLVALTCETDADMPDMNELDLDPDSVAEPTFGFIAEATTTTVVGDMVDVSF